MKFDFVIGNPPYQVTIREASEGNNKNTIDVFDDFQNEAIKVGDKTCLIYPAKNYQREIPATYVSLSIMKSVRCMMYLILAAKQISLCTFHPFPEKNSLKSNMSQSICGSHTGMLQIHTSQTVLSLWIRFML